MWYFAWILGVTAALAMGIINVMWYEFQNAFEIEDQGTAEDNRRQQVGKANTLG